MVADRLTKVLTNTTFEKFKTLGLVDVSEQLKDERKLKDITEGVNKLFLNLE